MEERRIPVEPWQKQGRVEIPDEGDLTVEALWLYRRYTAAGEQIPEEKVVSFRETVGLLPRKNFNSFRSVIGSYALQGRLIIGSRDAGADVMELIFGKQDRKHLENTAALYDALGVEERNYSLYDVLVLVEKANARIFDARRKYRHLVGLANGEVVAALRRELEKVSVEEGKEIALVVSALLAENKLRNGKMLRGIFPEETRKWASALVRAKNALAKFLAGVGDSKVNRRVALSQQMGAHLDLLDTLERELLRAEPKKSVGELKQERDAVKGKLADLWVRFKMDGFGKAASLTSEILSLWEEMRLLLTAVRSRQKTETSKEESREESRLCEDENLLKSSILCTLADRLREEAEDVQEGDREESKCLRARGKRLLARVAAMSDEDKVAGKHFRLQKSGMWLLEKAEEVASRSAKLIMRAEQYDAEATYLLGMSASQDEEVENG